MTALIDHADHEEQTGGGEPVTDHLDDRALNTEQVEADQAQHYVTQVTDRRVGDDLFDVGLHQREAGTVDDAGNRKRHDRRREELRRIRKQGEAKLQKSVCPHLEQNAGEDHRARRRRFHMRIGKPRVQRHDRYFDGERQRESREQKRLHRKRQMGSIQISERERRHAGRLIK